MSGANRKRGEGDYEEKEKKIMTAATPWRVRTLRRPVKTDVFTEQDYPPRERTVRRYLRALCRSAGPWPPSRLLRRDIVIRRAFCRPESAPKSCTRYAADFALVPDVAGPASPQVPVSGKRSPVMRCFDSAVE